MTDHRSSSKLGAALSFLGGALTMIAAVVAILAAWPDVRAVVFGRSKHMTEEINKKRLELVLEIAQAAKASIPIAYIQKEPKGRIGQTPMDSSLADFSFDRDVKDADDFTVYYSPQGNAYFEFAKHADDILLPSDIAKAVEPFSDDYIRYKRLSEIFNDDLSEDNILLIGQSDIGQQKGSYLKSGSFLNGKDFKTKSRILVESINAWLSSNGEAELMLK
jgi:hypothetical protein